ncbi:hypothetical protein PoB_001841700 [Plakobranchus ocellatus]|uniref:Uncharacterized protein n=1 Tax=Plakobranchus ocellatus TaxID=259542 RepID=A0AAV3ZBK5_9GAST|nr:hypothetical protein PoB_001841700 [Plakobranchus ocellatus]
MSFVPLWDVDGTVARESALISAGILLTRVRACHRRPGLTLPSFCLFSAWLVPTNPYKVHLMQYGDIVDFKSLSAELPILDTRKDCDNEDTVTWGSIMELGVPKKPPQTIFYKTSHSDLNFKSVSFKRLTKRGGLSFEETEHTEDQHLQRKI